MPAQALSRVGSFNMVGAFAFGPVAFIAAGPVAAAFGARAVLGFGAAWAVFGTLAVLAVPAVRPVTWQEPAASRTGRPGRHAGDRSRAHRPPSRAHRSSTPWNSAR